MALEKSSLKISPVIINKAINELCLINQKDRPQFILLLAGNIVFLIDVEKWFKGSYLQFDLEELFVEGTIDRRYYSLFYLLLSKEMLAPDSEMVLMGQLEEDSHKSAYEVTKDLKEGIHYYFNENGYMVFTEIYHKQRGYCCGNGCKHCPFDTKK